jgi:hypothetical protein
MRISIVLGVIAFSAPFLSAQNIVNCPMPPEDYFSWIGPLSLIQTGTTYAIQYADDGGFAFPDENSACRGCCAFGY